LGNPHVEVELLPKPVKALRDMRVGSIAAAGPRSYAVANTGEVWAWGNEEGLLAPLDHGEEKRCPIPKPIKSLQDIRVDAVVAGCGHTLARADDGSVYAWGNAKAVQIGSLGLGASASDANMAFAVRTPQRISALHAACQLSTV
jgi:alpha-tubulin suppressor-like RCC1 family protein